MSKYATPNYILTNEEKLSVYEPSEDTFLLLDALEKDAELIEKQRPTICVEIGCGSGLASIFVAKYLQRGALILCTDINPVALRVSQRNADLNNLRRNCIEFLRTDTLDAIEYRLQSIPSTIHKFLAALFPDKIDLLLFNPPYVPSDEPLRPEDMLAHAYAGERMTLAHRCLCLDSRKEFTGSQFCKITNFVTIYGQSCASVDEIVKNTRVLIEVVVAGWIILRDRFVVEQCVEFGISRSSNTMYDFAGKKMWHRTIICT
uniref:Methyltransferase small domain-containing protein n=1 Tax=Romanomermis culicivorax TaxID=13658 RepID=A0A915L3T1_ROMCU